MICTKLKVDQIVAGKERQYANSRRIQLRYGGEPIKLILPKVRIPWNPKDKTNARGEVWARDITFTLGDRDADPEDPNYRHIEAMIDVLNRIDNHVEQLIETPIRKSVYQGNKEYPPTVTGTVKTEFGSSNFKINIFDRDKKHLPDFDTSTLRGWFVSGVLVADGAWCKTDGSLAGIDWAVSELRLYRPPVQQPR